MCKLMVTQWGGLLSQKSMKNTAEKPLENRLIKPQSPH